MSFVPITVWDLDNCLADDAWRIPRIDWAAPNPAARYAAYHAAAGADRLCPRNAAIFRAWRGAARPVFATGRPECIRRETVEWILRRLDVRVDETTLFMRGSSDHTSTEQLKARMLGHIRAAHPTARIVAAFDDHLGVVEAYRAAGLMAMQLYIHNVDAYTRPTHSQESAQ